MISNYARVLKMLVFRLRVIAGHISGHNRPFYRNFIKATESLS